MEKVKLPREVAESIEFFRIQSMSNEEIYDLALEEDDGKYADTLFRWVEGAGCRDDLMAALVNGYEVEQTREDMVRNYYENINPDTPCGTGSRFAIRETLNLLNIKITGVND